jgi:hypothetical protein
MDLGSAPLDQRFLSEEIGRADADHRGSTPMFVAFWPAC